VLVLFGLSESGDSFSEWGLQTAQEGHCVGVLVIEGVDLSDHSVIDHYYLVLGACGLGSSFHCSDGFAADGGDQFFDDSDDCGVLLIGEGDGSGVVGEDCLVAGGVQSLHCLGAVYFLGDLAVVNDLGLAGVLVVDGQYPGVGLRSVEHDSHH